MNPYLRTYLQHLHIGVQKGASKKGATLSPALRSGLIGALASATGGLLAGGALGGFDAWDSTRTENLSSKRKKDELKATLLGAIKGGGRGAVYGLLAGGLGSFLRKGVEASVDGAGASAFH